ncbi:MAG: hypothetical protein IJ859_05120, partial [Synergistaceae bacterium]|nr:hypothetical protein [Synergistaceae bacterium]
MTEKEYDELYEQYIEADKMAFFWERGIGQLRQAISAIEDLPYALLTKNEDDSKIIDEIVFKLDDFEKMAKDRYRFWRNKFNNSEDELHNYEDYSSLAEDDDGEPFEPYDVALDPIREDYDYVALGMGV